MSLVLVHQQLEDAEQAAYLHGWHDGHRVGKRHGLLRGATLNTAEQTIASVALFAAGLISGVLLGVLITSF